MNLQRYRCQAWRVSSLAMYIYIYTYHIYIYIYIYIYMRVYIHIYIYTYIRILYHILRASRAGLGPRGWAWDHKPTLFASDGKL